MMKNVVVESGAISTQRSIGLGKSLKENSVFLYNVSQSFKISWLLCERCKDRELFYLKGEGLEPAVRRRSQGLARYTACRKESYSSV